ncbi:hypothetical protein D9757_011550 [Collybiopsis confluens]|uniref:Uncharacterized protein n=1 Tax=Collybiopsis confluens TaxID=2823264 RepID=A0A8H5GAZ8_9AGAR|nr:hypothetical protein D9757_011550 [Collybiopsis confluens]
MSVIGEISAGIAIFNLISSLVDRARPAVQKKLPHRILSDGRAILDSEENIRRFNRLVELAPPTAKTLQKRRDRVYRQLQTTLVACDAGKKHWNVKIRLELFHKAEDVYKNIQVYEHALHNASSREEREANRRTLMSIPSIPDLRHGQSSGHLDPSIAYGVKPLESAPFYRLQSHSMASLLDIALQKALLEQCIPDAAANGVAIPEQCQLVGHLEMETEGEVLHAMMSGSLNPGGISINDDVQVTIKPQESTETLVSTVPQL